MATRLHRARQRSKGRLEQVRKLVSVRQARPRVLHQAEKTDEAGEGYQIGNLRGRRVETCPVRALSTWLERAGITFFLVPAPPRAEPRTAPSWTKAVTGPFGWSENTSAAAASSATTPRPEVVFSRETPRHQVATLEIVAEGARGLC